MSIFIVNFYRQQHANATCSTRPEIARTPLANASAERSIPRKIATVAVSDIMAIQTACLASVIGMGPMGITARPSMDLAPASRTMPVITVISVQKDIITSPNVYVSNKYFIVMNFPTIVIGVINNWHNSQPANAITSVLSTRFAM